MCSIIKRIKYKLFFLITISVIVFIFIILYNHQNNVTMIMGGSFSWQIVKEYDKETINNDSKNVLNKSKDVETYFRPSKLPVLNDRFFSYRFVEDYYTKKVSEIQPPEELLSSPEDTILNYFSILREAANFEKGKYAGCGTIGNDKTPYPLAYNFLSSSYQEKLSYEQYVDTFQNILHISLIKYKAVPVYDNPDHIIRYFVELETIGGSEKIIGNFVYYYGFIELVRENKSYKISNIDFHGENYLCAPYHGWSWDAEGSVEVRYGGWCKLIKSMYPVFQKGYVKNIIFKGTDGYDYLIVFYQLTNDTDLEISQYRKKKGEDWKLIQFDPEKCLKN